MKRFVSWLCVAAVWVNMLGSYTIVAQEPAPPTDHVSFMGMVDLQWELLADFRSRFEEDFHVTLTKNNAYELFHSLLPEVIERTEENMSIRWGFYARPEYGGLSIYPAPPGTPRWKGAAPVIEVGGPQWVRIGGAAGFILMVWGAYNFEDKLIEGAIYRYQVEVEGLSSADAKKEANYLSDKYEEAVAKLMAIGNPANYSAAPLMMKLLQELERLYEQDQDRFHHGEHSRYHFYMPFGEGFPG
ncbi:MAG: hypothetical protein JO360_10795, partial [Acidobacteria bacterium]|nr:hypothetical protein [Acidobacteriota bacterium]